MNASTLAQGTVVNLFVLLGFVAVCAMLRAWSATQQRAISSWFRGGLFGGMAIVAMLVPVTASSGMIFDSRAGVMGTVGLLFGPLAALVAVPIAIAFRLHLGGSGVIPGCLEIFLPALVGSGLQVWYRRQGREVTVPRVVVASLVVGFSCNATILLVVHTFFAAAMTDIGIGVQILVLVNAPLSMMVLSSLIVLEQRHAGAIASLADSERRMLHSQKMAAVGELAGKISHGFINTLTVLTGNAQLIEKNAYDPTMVTELAGSIVEAVQDASGLVAELLAFSVNGPLEKQPVDLARSVKGIGEILLKSLDPGIELVIDVDDHAGKVNADSERLGQAVLHMAINAREAIAGSGRVTIAVEPARLTRRQRRRLQGGTKAQNYHDGPFVLLSVQDSGRGMTPEVAARIFEPYFSTKPRSEKVGLGLASVYAIVKQHDGFIDVDTKVGRGTTMRIYLPTVG